MQYTTEVLPNIRQVHVYIRRTPTTDAVRKTSPKVKFRPRFSVGLHSFTITDAASNLFEEVVLNVTLAARQTTVARYQDCIVLKIPLLEGSIADPTPEDTDTFPQAEELSSQLKAFYCRVCSTRIATTSTGQTGPKLLPLPSPYWQEMGDLWWCHNADIAVIKPSAALVRKPGYWLIGKCHVELPWQDLHLAGIQSSNRTLSNHASSNSQSISMAVSTPGDDEGAEEDTGDGEDAGLLSCAGCQAHVGEMLTDSQQVQFARLYKQSLSTVDQLTLEQSDTDTIRNLFTLYNTETTFANTLLALAESKTVYRFILCCPVKGVQTARAELTLLNTTLRVKTNTFPAIQLDRKRDPINTQHNTPCSAPVLKVAFRVLPKNSPDAAANVHAFKSKGSFETLLMSTAAAEETLRVLSTRAKLLPESCRRMGKNTLSYLRLLSRYL